MLRDLLFVGWSDLKIMLRSKETLVWTFLMPAVFFYFIGSISGGDAGFGGSSKLAVRGMEDAGFLGEELLMRLDQQGFQLRRFDRTGAWANAEPLSLAAGEQAPVFEDYFWRLDLPKGLTESVLHGEPVELYFASDQEGQGADLDNFRLKRATYTVLADVLAASGLVGGEGHGLLALTREDMAELHAKPRALSLRVGDAGERKHIPSGFEQAVPGTMVMFTLLVLLTSGATTLVLERRTGLLRRLASAPMSRGSVVGGKWFGKFVLALVQICFAMLLGRFAFGVHWGPALPMVVLTLASYAALLASLGILLGNWAKSEGQAVAVGVLAANLLGALGGCWWPVEVTSPGMQKLALFLPTGWMMDAMHQLVVFQHGWQSALPHALGMALGAWLLGLLGARSFRFE